MSCGCDPFEPVVTRRPGKVCSCKRRAPTERTAGRVPAGQPCAGGRLRNPVTGLCPEDEADMDFSGGGNRLTEAEWFGLTAAERALHEAAARRAGITWAQWIDYPRAQRDQLVAAERARGGGGGGGGGAPQCPLGEMRDPVTQQCRPFTQQQTPLPAGWENWNADQRAEYARQAVARQGGTTAEQQAAAERARAADNAMIIGIVTQGIGFIRSWLQGRTQERIAEIEARARVEVARIQAQAQGQGSLLTGWGTNPYGTAPPVQQASGGGGELMLLPLLMMMMR